MLKVTRLCCILLLLLTLVEGSSAQHTDIKFARLSLAEGLSQTSVYAILQDRRGFMWFGTLDGLNRYDGYGFTIYKHRHQDTNSLSSSSITALYEDRDGALWIGTQGGGLNRHDYKSQAFTAYRSLPDKPGGISNNEVNTICQDRAGALWIGTADGLNRFDPKSGQFTVYRHEPDNPASLISNNVKVVLEDSKGMIWIGTYDSGLSRYDPGSGRFTSYRHDGKTPGSISGNDIRALYEDSVGGLWIGTQDGGISRYQPQSDRFISYLHNPKDPSSLGSNDVRTIYQDNSGAIWIGTAGGLCKFDALSNSFTTYRYSPEDDESISSDKVLSIYQDRAGALWIGTFDKGLNRYDPISQRFNAYNFDAQNPNVYSIKEDNSGRLWIATYGGGLQRYDARNQTLTTYRHDANNTNSVSGNDVQTISIDSKGDIWLGTMGKGLSRYDPVNNLFTVYRSDASNPTSISSDYIITIYEDRSGVLWIGTYGGLNRYSPARQAFTVFRHDPKNPHSISSDTIFAICEDRAGALWLGTYGGGLNKFDRQSGRSQAYVNDPNDADSISNNIILAIYEDSQGVLWLGTAGGLNRYDPVHNSFTAFTESDGLANDVVYGILEDSQGNLWLSTNKGLSKFNPRTRQFNNYDTRDGLQSNEFNAGSCFKSSRGEMFFGGINGFNRFFPEQIKDNPYIPPVVITSFKILDKETDKTIADAITLTYEENVFSFEFAALNFTHPEKNRYAYRLEGFDPDWIRSGAQRNVRYTNLDPGEYLFRVKGSNNDGVWNEQGTAVRIIITPPPWRTWWAYLIYIAGLVSVSYGGYRYRLNTVEKNLKIERAIAIDKKNSELERKNVELANKNKELIESHNRADRIFSALAQALPGTVLDGKYRLDEKIGAGGFGAVYRATHLSMKHSIAVKVFKPSPGNDSAEALKRFQLEAVSACRINHPNAVVVLDSGISSDGIAYLVMELLRGHTLSAELRQKRVLSLPRAAQILLPVCDLLAKAHAIGMVHRDIKPDNIFLHHGEQGEIVKVVDFGIVKLMEVSESVDIQSLTGTGGIIGTPTYMSPERLDGKSYDGRSDVYSLGVVLYEMLCGCAPFRGDGGGVFSIVQMHLTKAPSRPRTLNENIPEAVEEIMLRALAKDPQKRPTAKELGEEFTKAAGIDIASLTTVGSEIVDLDLHRDDTQEFNNGITAEGMHQIEKALNSLLERTDGELAHLLKKDATVSCVSKPPDALTPQRWQQIEQLVYALLDCPPERRSALLDEACANDAELRRVVEGVLVAYEEDE